MTWLAIERPAGASELDAVLALHPETGSALRALAASARDSVDAYVFEPCVLRAAQLLDVDRAVVEEFMLLGHVAGHAGSESDGADRRRRLAIAYTEQFVIDHNQIGDDDIAQMLAEFSVAEFFRLQVAIGVVERVLRLCRIFEIGPSKGGVA